MHGHERGGLPAAAPAATQRNYDNVPGGPGHGRATARRESRLRWWADSQTGVLLLLAVLTWKKKDGPKRPRRSPLARLITSDVYFHLTSPVFLSEETPSTISTRTGVLCRKEYAREFDGNKE